MKRPFLLMSVALALLSLRNGDALAEGPGTRVAVPKGKAVLGTDFEEIKNLMGGTEAKPEWYADESPATTAEVEAFEIDAYEVTNKQFKAYFKEFSFPANMENHPAVNITWQEANDYCRAAGGRLPTEAEWNRAARGDTKNLYPWGNDFNPRNAVYMDTPGGGKAKVGSYTQEESGENMLGGTHPAGSIEAGKSQFGVYDLSGNVWEWLDGWYDEGKKLRMLKGGSWLSPKESLRVSARLWNEPNGRFNDFGFRCVYTKP